MTEPAKRIGTDEGLIKVVDIDTGEITEVPKKFNIPEITVIYVNKETRALDQKMQNAATKLPYQNDAVFDPLICMGREQGFIFGVNIWEMPSVMRTYCVPRCIGRSLAKVVNYKETSVLIPETLTSEKQ